MGERSDQDCREREESYTCVQGVEGRKQLARVGGELVDRPHPTQDHCGVHESIDP